MSLTYQNLSIHFVFRYIILIARLENLYRILLTWVLELFYYSILFTSRLLSNPIFLVLSVIKFHSYKSTIKIIIRSQHTSLSYNRTPPRTWSKLQRVLVVVKLFSIEIQKIVVAVIAWWKLKFQRPPEKNWKIPAPNLQLKSLKWKPAAIDFSSQRNKIMAANFVIAFHYPNPHSSSSSSSSNLLQSKTPLSKIHSLRSYSSRKFAVSEGAEGRVKEEELPLTSSSSGMH